MYYLCLLTGAFACSNADTWASELGSVISSNDPFLITTRVRVPRGIKLIISPSQMNLYT